MIDYTRIIEKIVPEKDGPSEVTRRKFIVAAINVDNTVDITDGAGVTTPNVPVLAGAQLAVGSNVQVLSERGAALVLGKVGASVDPVVPNGLFTFGTPSLTSGSVTALTITAASVNDGSMWSSGTNVTIPIGQGGLYSIGVTLWYATQATGAGLRQARVTVNGTEFLSETLTAVGINGIRAGVSLSTRRVVAAGDVITFGAFHSAGVNLSLDTNSHAWAQRVR